MRRALAPLGLLAVALVLVSGCKSKPKIHVKVAGIEKDLTMDVILHTHGKSSHSVVMYAHCPSVTCPEMGIAPSASDLKAQCPAVEVVQLDFNWPIGKAPEELPPGVYGFKPLAADIKGSGFYSTVDADHNIWGDGYQILTSEPVSGKLAVTTSEASLTGQFAGAITCNKIPY